MWRLSLIAALVFCFAAHAATIEQPLPDPAQEQVAQAMFHELKCVVCTGESLAESDAALAVNMRAQIRSMAAEGKSKTEIANFFRARYGDVIMLNPRLEKRTALLWLAPLLILTAGGFILYRSTQVSA